AATKLAHDFMQTHRSSSDEKLHITIVDPNPKLGGPLYNTPSINAFLAQPFEEIELPSAHGKTSSLRKKSHDQITYTEYGDYLRHHLDELCAEIKRRHSPVEIYTATEPGAKHPVPYMRAEVVAGDIKNDRAELKMSNGKTLKADVVVLATGNPLPENLRDSEGRPLEKQAGYYRCYAEGLNPEKLNETDNMVLLGMGASAHTFATSAIRNGYKGHIVLASRRGKSPECEPVPQPHKPPRIKYQFKHFTVENLQEMKRQKGDVTAEEFWELFLKETRHAAPMGFNRREIADLCFDDFNEMNRVMSVKERTRFAEKFGADWNFMTNRIPEVHRKILSELCNAGRVDYREKIVAIDYLEGGGFAIRFNDDVHPPVIKTPKIVNCTGPSVKIADMSPLLRDLQEKGHVVEHPLAGINVDPGLHVKDFNGQSSKIFYALGPLTQGEFFESVSIPAIQNCTKILAESIAQDHGLGAGAGAGMPGAQNTHSVSAKDGKHR
ncbi:MAG: hypothetical protein EBV03_04775, partial [Proteobacteria bacterium]|nr:hypothetical protein [Pseudomonadota bacterium]